jgi:hypothetical protein
VHSWLTANHAHPSWSYLWGRLWAVDPSLESACLVPLWLTSGPLEKNAKWVLGQLARSGASEIIEQLKAWLDGHANDPLASTVREAIDRRNPGRTSIEPLA